MTFLQDNICKFMSFLQVNFTQKIYINSASYFFRMSLYENFFMLLKGAKLHLLIKTCTVIDYYVLKPTYFVATFSIQSDTKLNLLLSTMNFIGDLLWARCQFGTG